MEPPYGISGAADCARARMGNGMEVFHVRGVRFASAAARVLVRTGSVHEGAMCGCGVSHFAEHMAFLGAGARGSDSVSADAAAMGAGAQRIHVVRPHRLFGGLPRREFREIPAPAV